MLNLSKEDGKKSSGDKINLQVSKQLPASSKGKSKNKIVFSSIGENNEPIKTSPGIPRGGRTRAKNED